MRAVLEALSGPSAVGEPDRQCLRAALAGYLPSVRQTLEDRAETVDRGSGEHRFARALAQGPDAQLQIAWLHLSLHAQPARLERVLCLCQDRVGNQLGVGDSIRGEVGTGGEG